MVLPISTTVFESRQAINVQRVQTAAKLKGEDNTVKPNHWFRQVVKAYHGLLLTNQQGLGSGLGGKYTQTPCQECSVVVSLPSPRAQRTLVAPPFAAAQACKSGY